MKLKEYLHKHCINHAAFARMIGISIPTLSRAKLGIRLRGSTIEKIVKGTQGEVTKEDLTPENLNVSSV